MTSASRYGNYTCFSLEAKFNACQERLTLQEEVSTPAPKNEHALVVFPWRRRWTDIVADGIKIPDDTAILLFERSKSPNESDIILLSFASFESVHSGETSRLETTLVENRVDKFRWLSHSQLRVSCERCLVLRVSPVATPFPPYLLRTW